MGDGGESDTGGNDGTDSGNGWDDESTGTLWGWLDSVVSGLKSIWTSLTDLPQTIIDGIKGVFIPDTAEIESTFNGFVDEMKMKFSFDTEFFENLFQGESVVSDVTEDYTIAGVGTFNLKFFDSKFLVDGVTYFRPFIRGFIVLLIMLYNVHHLLSFIRQDSGIVMGKGANMETRIPKGKGGKA